MKYDVKYIKKKKAKSFKEDLGLFLLKEPIT